MNVNANYQSQTEPSSLQASVKNIGLTLGNIVLYAVPIMLLVLPIYYWLPSNYVLLFVVLFVGQIIGAFLLVFVERRRIREAAQQNR